MKDFSVLLVATNKYVDYATGLINSINQNLFTSSSGQIIVFTDQPQLFDSSSTHRISVVTVQIPSYGWPEATLLRYKFFAENWNLVAGENVMYIDVDSMVVAPTELSDALPKDRKAGLSVVEHPGYFKKSLLHSLISKSSRGTWETNPKSTAFVPIWKRKKYVAGGVWLGSRSAIHQMVEQLNKNVDTDLKLDYIAKWHDESHLNAWVSSHKVNYLSPAWAHAPGYGNISHISPIIELVHKPQDFFDQRT